MQQVALGKAMKNNTWISDDNGETMEISFYHPEHDISGFQLEFDNCSLSGAENGQPGSDAGFTISAGNSTVLGFSFTGATIPSSDEVETLVYVNYNLYNRIFLDNFVNLIILINGKLKI